MDQQCLHCGATVYPGGSFHPYCNAFCQECAGGYLTKAPAHKPFAGLSEPERPAPPAPLPTRGRSADQILDALERNLTMALDCASIKLGRLREGSSAYKTQRGVVRGLAEALQALKSEMGGLP